MRTSVEALPRFKNRLKRLERKYRTAVGQVQTLIEQLERGERPGDRIPGVGSVVYKERLRNPAVPGGKPKGYRVIYYVQLADHVKLLTIYSKPEQEDISNSEIEILLAEADEA